MIPRRSRSEATSGIFSSRPQGPFAEKFRLLQGNLYQSVSGQKSRVVLVTSSTSADGKTTVAANLAKSLADDGNRVFLVDADLHRGRVHEPLNLRQELGLAEWLVTTQPSLFETLEAQRFVVLTTGTFPPNPLELLNEPLLEQIFAALREEFEYVIVDCARIPTVVDTMTLARFADLMLSVVNVSHTPRRSFAAPYGDDRRAGSATWDDY